MDDNNEEQKSFSPIQSSSYNYSESSKKSSLPIFSTHTPGIFGSARGIFVDIALSRANTLLDDNIYDNIHKQNEFRKQTILGDESLTTDEKTEAIKLLAKYYDKEKVLYNEGTRRICESCNQECLAALYCEYCVKNYLKANFLNWTSGNYDIDNLIQKCQSETLSPDKIIEWIPYHNLKNIKYLTKGGFSEIYIADWIGGHFYEWDSVKQQLKRIGTHKVILKKLENIESADQSWFNEVKYHLTLSNKYDFIVRCFGLTQNPSNGNYVLVMRQLDMDLRKYLQQNHNKLTWKERIQITVNIIKALVSIHKENLIHRDLHSGNILYDCYTNSWFIGNFGFCGPADNKLIIIYGNLPYMAPEVISGKTYISFASDIYSIAMLMWEISSGQAPIINFKHDYNLVMNIVNGMRPKVIPGTPIEYKNLMKQCWDADPLERPDINALWKKINDLSLFYQSKPNELIQNSSLEIDNLETVTTSKLLFTSKVHQFENLPEPKNATEGIIINIILNMILHLKIY
ncbi:kinase-like domain-containing protein [Rhizophagus irregularis DAOM 181602=DAOM 197198]|uniref:Kinase-like domain-containing protein n=1 Tax=Rhizophagus irregularis (strain DAOM 181602 / DAOM 197198 / MUCL 43194) TaxID=747089 RepID=A0A2P4Q243_RHIID|nr:kinase-like domain-containing protein [Rhizophagus irregularis DAOM 181602=DAOM 197198]POG71664.1 kinase-like domain-containing protein [Rhizophagus irregularis DAOM 181602=DAOM 197198]|eukprot:XP_025178530.1 kinase-like domain-containing protein [Rhizophagus irregularis DAOM 181602=DAOM 197198]